MTRGDTLTARYARAVHDLKGITRIRAGDGDALVEVYDTYGRPTYSLVRRILNDAELAEDVIQETFLKLWRSPDLFDPDRGSLYAWLMKIAHQ